LKTLALPNGKTVTHSSKKRFHVVVRVNRVRYERKHSSETRSLGLAQWRHEAKTRPAWLIDGETGEVIREPDSVRFGS
jgi:hypothetical protein